MISLNGKTADEVLEICGILVEEKVCVRITSFDKSTSLSVGVLRFVEIDNNANGFVLTFFVGGIEFQNRLGIPNIREQGIEICLFERNETY